MDGIALTYLFNVCTEVEFLGVGDGVLGPLLGKTIAEMLICMTRRRSCL